ncbi:MAG: DEAD/DEAH box helicase [Caldiserica bacterium]|nr:DEAD/DEAH box helicase [Caldisericota bacterium]
MNIDTSLAWHCPRIIAPYSVVEQRFHADELLKCQFDLVILDEAHYLNDPENEKTLRVIQNLRKKFFLLLSATPMHNDVRELYNIVSLLRPGHFSAWDEFEKDYVDVNSSTGLKHENTAKLRDTLKQVMIRNRRKDVTERYEQNKWPGFRFPERIATRIPLDIQELAPDSYEFYQKFKIFYQKNLKNAHNRNFVYSQMGEIVERLTSSPAAFMAGVNRYSYDIRRQIGVSFFTQLQKFALSKEPEKLVQPKIDQALIIAAKHVAAGHKILIFSQFNETTQYAYQKIQNEKNDKDFSQNLFIYDEEKDYNINQQALQKFHDCPAGVLFCPSQMSEGINLQFANVMINLDLPWDPMKIEQRIGRIQRLTSRFEQVNIYNLVLVGTIEDEILDVLEQKLRMFKAVIGQVDEIIGNLNKADDFSKMFNDLFIGRTQETDDGQQISTEKYIEQEIAIAAQRAEEDSRLNLLFKESKEEMQEREEY